MNKQAMCGDAARHEVVIQVASDVQLFCSNLLIHTKTITFRESNFKIFLSPYVKNINVVFTADATL